MHRFASVCLSVLVSGTYVVHHFNGTELRKPAPKRRCYIKVKGQVGQGQRSHWSKSNKEPKQRQVRSQQRQVASFKFESKILGLFEI